MKLGGRLQAAIEVLQEIEARHRPAADALRDWGLSHRFAGSGDRAAIGNFVYGSLRRKRTACALLDDHSARAAVLGAVILSGGETPALLDKAFADDRFAPEPLSDAERMAIKNFDPSGLADTVRANVPDWCVGELRSAFGDEWTDEADALAARPPLDLRVNTIKATRQKVLSALSRSGAGLCDIAPDGLRIPPISGHGRHPNVQAEPAFRKGWFEIQDAGSQIVSLIAASTSGGQVLDYCAGAGGKTLALSAAFDNKGQIFSHDADKHRLAPIFERIKRAGCRNVQVLAGNEALSSLEGRMDMVLVDAPCTGSGTWRRRPDAKWRLTERQLDQRKSEQAAILDRAARHVRPGGWLVYVTCSVFPAENAEQVSEFLVRTPMFQIGGQSTRSPPGLAEFPDRLIAGQNGTVLTPRRTGTDGFFISVMQRS